ncbi:MAG: hypothetical protein ACJA0Y_001425 [Maricaulis maris]|jgi:hypothetical protein
MNRRNAPFEFDWQGATVGIVVLFDDEGCVASLGDVTLPWGPSRSARTLEQICAAIVSADRYFRAPEMHGAVAGGRLIPLSDIVQVLAAHGETAFLSLMRVLAGAERAETRAVTERRSAAFLSKMEDV